MLLSFVRVVICLNDQKSFKGRLIVKIVILYVTVYDGSNKYKLPIKINSFNERKKYEVFSMKWNLFRSQEIVSFTLGPWKQMNKDGKV